MSNFTPKEIEYLNSQRLGRLATVNPAGNPQIAPVSFRYNAELDTIEIPGRFMTQSKKFKNILKNPHVSFVVDDVVLSPWQARGVEIRGTAEAVPMGANALFSINYPIDDTYIRISADQIIGWGLEGEGADRTNRKIEKKPA
ncbi:MAG: PPOX class F420-dependent oxidoreductase [Chloroflexota bacterium]